MKKLLSVATVLTLAGCTSVSGLLSDSPNISTTATGTQDSVVTCISNAWSNYMPINNVKQPDGSVRLVAVAAGNGPLGVVDIGNGSPVPVTYWQAGANFGIVQSGLRKGVFSCTDAKHG